MTVLLGICPEKHNQDDSAVIEILNTNKNGLTSTDIVIVYCRNVTATYTFTQKFTKPFKFIILEITTFYSTNLEKTFTSRYAPRGF